MNSYIYVAATGESMIRKVHIANEQLKALSETHQQQVYEFVGKLYQRQLEGDEEAAERAVVSFKHDPGTDVITYQLICSLRVADQLLEETQKICVQISEHKAAQEVEPPTDEDAEALLNYYANEPNDFGSPRG